MEGSTKPVLIVALDDDAANLVLLRRIFARRTGTEVLTESDGRRGLELVRVRRPDVVLLDLNLDGFDGEAVLKELRGAPETANIAVVVISGDVTEMTKQRLIDAGANYYVEKPLIITEVLEMMDEILASR